MEKSDALALSSDIFKKANIGVWVYELDEGSEPRLYGDDTVLKLLGLEPGTSPEASFRIWQSQIAPEQYCEIVAATEKMMRGTYTDIQYSWKHPDGTLQTVRSGGIRDFSYTKGIRIEGIYQIVTDRMHFQSRKLGTIALDKDILTKANIGLWAFELDEGCEPRMYADEAMMKLIGLDHEVSPEEAYHAWYDHIDAQHYDEVSEAVEKMVSGIHAEVQYPWHHPNGETWIVRCGGVRNYAYTRGIRIEGTHQNVTALTHFEKRNLTDLLASLSENFLQVYFLDPYTGSFDSYAGNAFDGDENRDFSKINFYQDVAERSGSIVHPEDKPLIDKMYSRENLISVLESGKPTEFIIRWPTGKGNECIYMKNRLVPYGDDDGAKKLVIGVLDVTAQLRSAKALEEKNAYLSHFIDGFKSAYIVDLANDSFEIIHMEHEFRSFFRMDGGKAEMNDFIREHIHPEDRELIMQMNDSAYLRERLKTEKEISFTVREIYGDIEKTMRVLIMRGADYTRAAVGFMDISDEIAKEKEYSRRLEAANKAKSTFLFNMSHDIRTPMNAIIGFAEMAQKYIDDKKKVADCLDKVMISSKHLLNLINDVLDMARIESGKIRLSEQVINLKSVFKTAMDISMENAMLRHIALDFKTAYTEDSYVYGDELKINQITLNILSNAIKYTNPGGRVSVNVDDVPCNDPETLISKLTVEDNGIGMSKAFLEKIFVPFERSSSSTKSGVQGTGLGMAITKELIKNMGGEISVESELNAGTKVCILFKFRKAESGYEKQAVPDYDALEHIDLKGKKVLLVEDNDLNIEIAEDILTEAGMIVDTAKDGEIAVEIMRHAEKGRYDLILMDIQMPRMDGYEAAKTIRKLPNPYAAGIPIIAMTANAFEEDKKNAFEAGMNGHIAKPINVPELIHTLADILKDAPL